MPLYIKSSEKIFAHTLAQVTQLFFLCDQIIDFHHSNCRERLSYWLTLKA